MQENTYFYKKEDAIFPKRFEHLPGMPSKLYVMGDLPREDVPTVGIVGARLCSTYGRNIAYEYARILAGYGIQIISGMARGIDGHAHEGALAAQGRTFAVLGGGVDICYPKENRRIYDQMWQGSGGLISEYPCGMQPQGGFFPARNRIISALSDILIVVEAKQRSGSLITVDCALEQGKTVYAVPGRVGDLLSDGCNRLIAQGAGIAYAPESILFELGILTKETPEKRHKTRSQKKSSKKIVLASDLELVYSCVDLQARGLDELSVRTKLSHEHLIQNLLELQLRGLIEETAVQHYIRKT